MFVSEGVSLVGVRTAAEGVCGCCSVIFCSVLRSLHGSFVRCILSGRISHPMVLKTGPMTAAAEDKV